MLIESDTQLYLEMIGEIQLYDKMYLPYEKGVFSQVQQKKRKSVSEQSNSGDIGQ